MRRIITFTILALTLTGGVALADRDHRGHRDHRGSQRWDRGHDHGRDRGRGRVVVRDHRWGGRIAAPGWHRPHYRPHYRSYRRPVYVNNGYFQFHNGYRYAYARPVIHRRFYDYRIRPQIIVENYQPIAGYIWVRGQWSWNGYEWMWTNGHYEADPSYVDPSYNQPTYEEPAYDPNQPAYDPNQPQY